MEALGFRFAMQFMVKAERRCFILEGDAQGVVKMLQRKTVSNAEIEVIIQDVISLSESLVSISYNFIPRSCNRVADLAAKYALSIVAPMSWEDNFPTWAQLEADLDSSVI